MLSCGADFIGTPFDKIFFCTRHLDLQVGFLPQRVFSQNRKKISSSSSSSQVQSELGLYKYESTAHAIRTIVATEGISGLYRAYGATLVAFGPQTAINLALYEQLEDRATAYWNSMRRSSTETASTTSTRPTDGGTAGTGSAELSKPVWLTSGCAALSGCTACLVTTPLDLAKLRMQVVRAARAQAKIDAAGHSRKKPLPFQYQNIVHAVYRIAIDEGPRALFKGALLRCMLWVPQTAIFLGTFKHILSRLDES